MALPFCNSSEMLYEKEFPEGAHKIDSRGDIELRINNGTLCRTKISHPHLSPLPPKETVS